MELEKNVVLRSESVCVVKAILSTYFNEKFNTFYCLGFFFLFLWMKMVPGLTWLRFELVMNGKSELLVACKPCHVASDIGGGRIQFIYLS